MYNHLLIIIIGIANIMLFKGTNIETFVLLKIVQFLDVLKSIFMYLVKQFAVK